MDALQEKKLEVPSDITVEFIQSNWPLTNIQIESIPTQGLGGQVVLVKSTEGKYVCKTAGSWKTQKALERDLYTFEFLNEKKFNHAPRLLKTKQGTSLVKTPTALHYLLGYVEGSTPPFTPETYGKLGRAIGDLHNIGNFPFASDLNAADIVADLIKNAEIYPFKSNYIKLLKKIPDLQSLSQVPMHSDVALSNTIEGPDGSFVLIDWDEVGLGPAVMDLGAPLINQFITEEGFNLQEESLKAYFHNYFLTHAFPETELPYIFEAGLFWACVYIKFGDAQKRWQRIEWAIANKQQIIDLYTKVFKEVRGAAAVPSTISTQ